MSTGREDGGVRVLNRGFNTKKDELIFVNQDKT
jgi:hypothetical protein